MSRTPLFIFDLDGTLADCRHRLPLIQQETPDWDAFFAACVHDQVIPASAFLLNKLSLAMCEVQIWTGRSEIVRKETGDWLGNFTSFDGEDKLKLRMRGKFDRRPDDELKETWLKSLLPEDRARLVAVFEDRQRVVDMWRRNGVPCFQADEGKF